MPEEKQAGITWYHLFRQGYGRKNEISKTGISCALKTSDAKFKVLHKKTDTWKRKYNGVGHVWSVKKNTRTDHTRETG